MLTDFDLWNLHIFGEGAGEGAGEGDAGEAGDIDIPSSIPARARENYKKAVSKTSGSRSHESAPQDEGQPDTTGTEGATESHVPYAELIKSDAYKEEHKAYMDKTISDRLKKYKGLEEKSSKQDALLALVAQKYGIDTTSADYLDALGKSIEEDDSYYEKYAMENDISAQEARKIVTLERKVAEQERVKQEQEREERRQNNLAIINRNAEQTKLRFPNFDLDTEMQNERFVRLVMTNNGDTTAAYMATHWEEVLNGTAQRVQQTAVQKAQQAAANAVKANQKRPVENGLGGKAASVGGEENFAAMNLEQLRAWAAEQRRKKQR